LYLDWHNLNRDAYVIDIETDGLDATRIWVLCWRNVKTGETGECKSISEIKGFFDQTSGGLYVGHNILKFDAPTLVRLVDGVSLGAANCIDTLVLSTLYSPSLPGGHSLQSWGGRLGKPKIEFDDWSRLTPEMVEYCHQDVAITAELFVRLIKTLRKIGFSEKSVWIQHHFTVLLDRQHRNGFYFDGHRALGLLTSLRSRQAELEELIHVAFPPQLEELAHYKLARKKNGEYSSQYLRHRQLYELVEIDPDGSYRVFGRTPFNIGSPKQRVEKLKSLGWVCKEFTEKGGETPFIKGKLAPSLEKFLETHDIPEVHLIAKWMSIGGRANMIGTWLDAWNEEDSCIHGKLFVADTLRLRHQSPNTANIPAVRTAKGGGVLRGEEGYYTYEARDLWCARPGRMLVGTDAAGLELRMLAHYLNRPDFTDQVVNGDPHQYNADLVGITRPQAKTLIYAVLYGAAPPKVAKTLDISVGEAANIRTLFLERLGVGTLINECQKEQRNGRVTLVDGSKVVCPSPHAALNYRLQGGGARVMALGAILLERSLRKYALDSLKVGDIHDEWQYDVHPEHADLHGELAVQAIREAGDKLALNVPLDGESKKGLTWAETH